MRRATDRRCSSRGGTITFFDTSTAGNATLIAGGSFGMDDYATGPISFDADSTADNATLTADAGDDEMSISLLARGSLGLAQPATRR